MQSYGLWCGSSTPLQNMAGCLVSPPLGSRYACIFNPRLRNKGKANERREWSIALEGHKDEDDVKNFARGLYAIFQDRNPGLRPGKNGLPYYEEQDETGMATGIMLFNFSRRQLRGNGEPNTAPFVEDASSNPWPPNILIGNGSIVKVAFTVWRWNPHGEGGAGIGLELEGVRVLVHSEYVAPPPPDYSGVFGGPEPGHELPPEAYSRGEIEGAAQGVAAPPPARWPAAAPQPAPRPLSSGQPPAPQSSGTGLGWPRRDVIGAPQGGDDGPDSDEGAFW